jgi:protein SCO1/2
MSGPIGCGSDTVDRRRWLAMAVAVPLAVAGPGSPRAHAPFGRVEPPQPAPALPLRGADAVVRRFDRKLLGRVTAVQLMFTGCTATCPLQGALFGAVAQRLAVGDARLLSLSVDPLNDDPKALSAWLARFGTSAVWQAAAPRIEDVDRLYDHLAGRDGGADRHSTQVFLFDRRARLVYRTPELPPVAHVLEVLEAIDRSRP